ncbi:MAG: hypothetical protein EDX89_18220 [Acidobacteria bacterium]|nr:MAG: hypothetical protein EDX89_18220 [Acidobacteriota bacterium]MCE7959045.1 hypothetical protein [Acidobacteria bacterium ACB2]
MNADLAVPGPSPELSPQEVVLRFLESVGRPSEARLYLDLFRARPREQFAAISVDAHVMADAADAVVQDLRFLAALGLLPTVVLGIFQPADAGRHARLLARHLRLEGIPVVELSASRRRLPSRVTACAAAGSLPLVVFAPREEEPASARLDRLGSLLEELQARKLLFLHRPGGLRQGGELVPIVNLATDVPSLLGSRELSRKEALVVEHARRLCEGMAPLPFTVAVTSPLNLLRELFTVKGAGTLLRRGARVVRHEGWEGVDLPRLRDLLASSFGRPPAEGFFARTPDRVYLEDGYRGCAVLAASPFGAYLTKFAVSPEAQGEGIARDLWEAVAAENPAVLWRARRANPVREWYARICDGLVREAEWTVYWKGLPHEAIPAAVDFAVGQPVDIPRDED